MNETSWGMVGGIIGALVTAVAAAVLKIMTARYEQQRQTRFEALAEYKGLVEQLRSQTGALQDEVDKLHEANSRCREENAVLRGELRLLQCTVYRLQVRTGDDLPPTLTESQVVTNSEGVITQVNPAALMLFHYEQKELVGKSVKVLIPQRFHADHDSGLERVRATGLAPWADRVILGFGLTKEGVEVPVAVTPSAFLGRDGKWVFGAAIRRRDEPGRPLQPVPPPPVTEPRQ
jgi:PAS domain S-box-containing protein